MAHSARLELRPDFVFIFLFLTYFFWGPFSASVHLYIRKFLNFKKRVNWNENIGRCAAKYSIQTRMEVRACIRRPSMKMHSIAQEEIRGIVKNDFREWMYVMFGYRDLSLGILSSYLFIGTRMTYTPWGAFLCGTQPSIAYHFEHIHYTFLKRGSSNGVFSINTY